MNNQPSPNPPENAKTGRGSKLKPSELSIFCTQIAMFLRSGITLVEGLGLLIEDLDTGRLSACVKKVYKFVEDRELLSDAMKKAGGFPDYMIRMVAIGEVSGNLEDMLYSLSRYYERDQALKQRIKSAITYPIVLLLMMSAIVLLLIVQVLPMFNDILQAMGSEMPGVVKGIMAFGQFLSAYWMFVLGGIILLVAGFMIMKRTKGGALFWDRFKASFPISRSVTGKIAAERFSTAMAFLIKSNIGMESALEFAKDILGNTYMSKRIEEVEKMTAQGESVYDAVYKAGIFPRLFTRMLGIGFKTGDLDGMMQRLSEIYEQDVDATLKRLTSIIEPAFVAILSVIVGLILISVMLPLIEVMSSM